MMSLSALDWFLIVAINGSIILYGVYLSRGTKRSVDWFLAAKGLPWWMVGLSMFATAVDSGDYVAVAGGAYKFGLSYISSWWLGLSIGWCLVAFFLFVPMYRAGMFTNAEYLEFRFGPVARVISVLIQIQSRTNVMANVAFSLYLTFSVLTGWGTQTWWLVVGIALAAATYTALGGLRSVAVTDTIQSVVMILASIVLWWTVWDHVGGWQGLENRLDQHVASHRLAEATAHSMTHVGGLDSTTAPPVIVVLGFILALSAYCTINQSQAMRLLAARSIWDMKMAAVVAGSVTAFMMWFNVTLGVLGRAVVPDLETTDQILPTLIEQFAPTMQAGLLGIIVAGLLAGGLSTYDSIGSALASVFTRDIYARFIHRHGTDRHYLLVSRIVTVVVILASFAYIPFLKAGMLEFYLKLAGVAVIPLFTVYLMGVFTGVARSSATIGLSVAMLAGLTRFMNPILLEWGLEPLPVWWTDTWWGYLWSILVTSLSMIVASMITGWESRETFQAVAPARPTRHQPSDDSADEETAPGETWLERSRQTVPTTLEGTPQTSSERAGWWLQPWIWASLLLLIVGYLNLVVFW